MLTQYLHFILTDIDIEFTVKFVESFNFVGHLLSWICGSVKSSIAF